MSSPTVNSVGALIVNYAEIDNDGLAQRARWRLQVSGSGHSTERVYGWFGALICFDDGIGWTLSSPTIRDGSSMSDRPVVLTGYGRLVPLEVPFVSVAVEAGEITVGLADDGSGNMPITPRNASKRPAPKCLGRITTAHNSVLTRAVETPISAPRRRFGASHIRAPTTRWPASHTASYATLRSAVRRS